MTVIYDSGELSYRYCAPVRRESIGQDIGYVEYRCRVRGYEW